MTDNKMSLPVVRKSIEADGHNSRRSSLGSINSLTIVETTPSRYLQPSASSCHDVCKYGGKHAFEEKKRRPLPKKVTNKSLDKEIVVEIFSGGKRIAPVKVRSSSSRSDTPDAPEVIKRAVATEVVDKDCTLGEDLPKISPSGGMLENGKTIIQAGEVITKKSASVPEKLVESSASKSASTDISAGQKKKVSCEERRKTLDAKVRNEPVSNVNASKKNTMQSISSSAKQETTTAKTTEKARQANLSAIVTHASSVKQNKVVKLTQEKGTQGLKTTQGSPKAVTSPRSSLDGVSKAQSSRRLSLPPKLSLSKAGKVLASPKPFPFRVASLKSKNRKCDKGASTLKTGNRNIKTDNERSTTNKAGSDEAANELRETHIEMVLEKSLYPTDVVTKNEESESGQNEALYAEFSPSPSSSSVSASTSQSFHAPSDNEEDVEGDTVTESEDSVLSEYDETEYIEVTDHLEGKDEGVVRSCGMVPSENTNSEPVKLRFRSGKVINIQSVNNSPRRLKFRRGRVPEAYENLRADSVQSFRKKATDADSNNDQPESEKVVLRHQEVQEKKDAQGLLNNVIEETASKLVETRKSKVKALVGAFETVISLQDHKPAANIVSVNCKYTARPYKD